MSTLILADHDAGVLSPATARLVAALSPFGPVDILVLAENPDPIARAASGLMGVANVLTARGQMRAESAVALLQTITVRYPILAMCASSAGKDIVPRLAARLGLMPVTDVVAILAPNRFVRPIYAGNALQTLTDSQPQHLLTLRASAFLPAVTGNAAPIQAIEDAGQSAVSLIAAHRTPGDRPDLATARVVVAGGVAVGSAEGFQLIEMLGRKLGAAIGATRAAVDAGYAPNDWQVGQTGKVIAPDLYIAIGISGALQHLAGIQGAKKIIAINTDPEAPLVRMADATLIGDLFEIVPQLIAELERLGVGS